MAFDRFHAENNPFPLSDLQANQHAVIADLSRMETKAQKRFAALGLTRGTKITLLRRAPYGDPLAVRVGNYTLALRRKDAAHIHLSRDPSAIRNKANESRSQSLPSLDKDRAIRLTRQAAERSSGCNGCQAKCKRRMRSAEQTKKEITVALAGNPNSGKTTLFNALTGARESIGNHPGITVDRSERCFSIGKTSIRLTDLPGIYSLTNQSAEECGAKEFLLDAQPHIIINIADATNLRRNLFLTMQLRSLGIPMLLALNMMDEAETLGIHIDPIRLSERLGIPIVPICARKGIGIDALLSCLEAIAADLKTQSCTHPTIPNDAETIYAQIDRILADAIQTSDKTRKTDERIDRLLLHRFWGIPIFLLLMGIVFVLTFDTLGAFLSDGMERLLQFGLEPLIETCLKRLHAPIPLQSFVLSGIVGGIGGVLMFLPQIMLLFLFLSLLEDSGYLSRAAFLTDRILRHFGLSGKACIPLLMGFGCTVPAALAARTMERENDRKMTLFLLPYISCSAKLPVYGMLASALFPKHRGPIILSLYLFGIAIGALVGSLLQGTLFSREDAAFVLELPPYRRPTVRSTLLHVADRAEHFLLRAGTLILAMNILLSALSHLDPMLQFTNDASRSLLGIIGTKIAPIFSPMGFGHWQAAVSLLTGLAAKEAVTASLSMFADASGTTLQALFSPASGYAFLVFVLLSLPCAAAITTMMREWKDRRCTALFLLLQSGIAYLVSYLAFTLVRLLGI